MTRDEIKDLINDSAEARTAISDYAQYFEQELAEIHNIPHYGLDGTLTEFIAVYIEKSISWKADRWGHKDYARPANEVPYPPSQSRPKVIKELQFLSELFSREANGERTNLKGRKSISRYAYAALLKNDALGLGLISHLQCADINPAFCRESNDLGLGGHGEAQIGEGLVFGFIDPGILTRNDEINTRLINRMIANTAEVDETHLLRVDPVRWSLTPTVINVLADARRCRRGRHIDLYDVRRRLDYAGRVNLAECAKQAARLLEITFHMMNMQSEGQAHETIETWLYAVPLARFIVNIFEALVPIEGVMLDEIKIAKNACSNVDALTLSASRMAEDGIACAAQVIQAIPALHDVDLDIGAGLFEITDGERRQERIMEAERDREGRLAAGRTKVIARLWELRHAMLVLRGYIVFTDWYLAHIMPGVPDELFVAVLTRICNPLTDWGQELSARYHEGVIYKRDIKRRAGGVPRDTPAIPRMVITRAFEVMEYPLNRGFGAVKDDVVWNSLLALLDKEDPGVRQLWADVNDLIPLDPVPG